MADLFGYDPGRAEGDVGLEMAAVFSDDGLSRLHLRYTWDATLPAAAWFMNNPSQAGRLAPGQRVSFDPTARRVIHFSRMLGAGSAYLVNGCPLISTDPAFLWRKLREDGYPADLERLNLQWIAEAAGAAEFLVVACGPEGMRRHRDTWLAAFNCFRGGNSVLCLGTTEHGAPLHPLARGRFAIPNDRRPVPFNAGGWSNA